MAFTLSILHYHLVSAKGLTAIFIIYFNTFRLMDKEDNDIYSLCKTPELNLVFVQDAAASLSTKFQLCHP
jgi:hypothetical protein